MEAARRPGQEPLGPAPEPPAIHPSFIQVARPYMFEQTIQDCVQAMGMNPMREEGVRLQGVSYIDNVRKVLHLYVPSKQISKTTQRDGQLKLPRGMILTGNYRPVRTFNTASMYYHRFRLVHPDNEYNFMVFALPLLAFQCII